MRELSESLLSTYDASKAAALFATFVKNDTWICPTLTVLRSMASLDDPKFTSDPRTKYMPRQLRTSWDPANDPRNATKGAEDYALDRRVYRRQVELVGAMHKAGVKIIAGTDVLNPFVFPGFSLHDELGLLVEAGLTPAEALRAATLRPAQYLGAEKTSGTIEPGKNADLVLLEGNPLDDIANTRRISAVVTVGRRGRTRRARRAAGAGRETVERAVPLSVLHPVGRRARQFLGLRQQRVELDAIDQGGPLVTTAEIRRVLAMSSSGLPSSNTRSAFLPGWIVPLVFSAPRYCAEMSVAARSASAGVRPASTSSPSSSCRLKPGNTNGLSTSVPAMIFTPALCIAPTSSTWRR